MSILETMKDIKALSDNILDTNEARQVIGEQDLDEWKAEKEKEFLDWMAAPEQTRTMFENIDRIADFTEWLETEFKEWIADEIDDAINSGPGFKGDLA